MPGERLHMILNELLHNILFLNDVDGLDGFIFAECHEDRSDSCRSVDLIDSGLC